MDSEGGRRCRMSNTESVRDKKRDVRADAVLSFAEIISALSFAIDLTEGAVPGHAVRCCILGMRIAGELNLPQEQITSLYYALLLKDAGCSNNAARMCQIVGGDDRTVKNGAKLQDWTRPHRPTLDALRLLWRVVLPTRTTLERILRILQIGLAQHKNNAEMITLRCERGAEIARKLGLTSETADAIRSLDEHWNGSGYPDQSRGKAIPRLARILAIAQHLDVFACERDPQVAIAVLRERSGSWFDPSLVRVVLALDARNELWTDCLPDADVDAARRLVLKLQPETMHGVGPEEIDRICEAFADVVDAKSPFTYQHSMGVAELAHGIAVAMDLPSARCQLVRRAALLHDLGKLAVPNTILDKREKLTDEEWSVILEHPRLTREILARIKPFEEMAEIAGAHHERLDGSGYPDQRQAEALSVEARVIAVADFYRALVEDRPYREGMPHAAAMEILEKQPLDMRCVAALHVAWGQMMPVPS